MINKVWIEIRAGYAEVKALVEGSGYPVLLGGGSTIEEAFESASYSSYMGGRKLRLALEVA